MKMSKSQARNPGFPKRLMALGLASTAALAVGFMGTYIMTAQSARALTDYGIAAVNHAYNCNLPAGSMTGYGASCTLCAPPED